MIDIRLVYTHDAAPFAENLARLLAAEDYNVRSCCGRRTLHEIEASRNAKEAVMLVWSYDAPGQHFMLEWARATDASRLVEVSRAPGAPRKERRAPIIDFASWRGERSARAWLALSDRLRAVARVLDPPKPAQVQATVALGLASMAAVAGAFVVRANDSYEAPVAPEQQAMLAPSSVSAGMGGAMRAVEPASYGNAAVHVRAYSEAAIPLASSASASLQQIAAIEPVEFRPEGRNPTLLEQFANFLPQPKEENSGEFLLASASPTQPMEDSPRVYFVTHLE
jgi:hypothetical protein